MTARLLATGPKIQVAMPKNPGITRRNRKVSGADMKERSQNPAAEIGSVKKLFEDKTSREIIEEAREVEKKQDAKNLEHKV